MKTIKKLSIQLCKDNPNTLFVFGDNLLQRGKAGQAIIRDESNAFGIPTKRLPSMTNGAFFSDQSDEYLIVLQRIVTLYSMARNHEIFFPEAGIGTGLAKMETESPKLFKLMNFLLEELFS